MSCGGATQVQLVALTAVDSYLTAAATSTFFAYRSMPYAVFGLEFAELQLTGAQTLNEKSTTQGTCTIDRRGDKLAKIYLQFKADAIMNITQDAITLHGAVDDAGSENAAIMKKCRGIVGGHGHKHWVPVRLSDTAFGGAVCSVTTAGVVAVPAGTGALIKPGDRATVITGLAVTAGSATGSSAIGTMVTLVQSIATDNVQLELQVPVVGATNSAIVHFEREISRGSVDCGPNPFVSETFEWTPFSKTAIDGPRADTGQSAIGLRYRAVGGDPHDLAAYYRPFAPCLLIDTVTLLCGSQCLDTLTASALVIYHELYVPKHAQGIRNLNATRDIAQLKKWALQPQVWRMLLPFNMCTSYAKALSLVSICLHNLKLNIKFNPVMVAVGNGVGGIFLDTMAVVKKTDGGAATNTAVRTCAAQASDSSIMPWATHANSTASTSDPLAALATATFKGSNIACTVLVEYVYTGKAEREMEVNLTDRMVVTEHQTMQNIVLSGVGAVTTQITVNHPIASIFCTAVSSAHMLHGDKQNYDGHPDPLTYTRDAPRDSLVPLLKTMQLKFNSAERTPAYDTTFYREILNVNALKNTPDTDICAIHFGIASAYDPQQSGSANLARLERVDMVTLLNPCYTKDNSNVGGLQAAGSTVGAGQMSAAHQVTLTFDFLSVNVWEVKDCMMGRMYA
jgi:hypothetical protein